MNNSKWKRLHEPADYFGPQEDRKRERKTQQLCRQVYRTVSTALAGECGDELLRDLTVACVEAAPDASRLIVKVYGASGQEISVHHVLERLERVRGKLRHAVAGAIVRKRAPELVFMVIANPVNHSRGEVEP